MSSRHGLTRVTSCTSISGFASMITSDHLKVGDWCMRAMCLLCHHAWILLSAQHCQCREAYCQNQKLF